MITQPCGAPMTNDMRRRSGRVCDRTAGHHGKHASQYSAVGLRERLERWRNRTPGEIANPGFAYRDANGRPLVGPCDTPGCRFASLPGGGRHAGDCEPRP